MGPPASFESIEAMFSAVKRSYDRKDGNTEHLIYEMTLLCFWLLRQPDVSVTHRDASGKNYRIYSRFRSHSRPCLDRLFDERGFDLNWSTLLRSANPLKFRFAYDEDSVNATVYTALMAFALCVDLWKPSSRKSPGTYFEIITGTLISKILKNAQRGKHITLPEERMSVLDMPDSEVVLEDEALNTEDAINGRVVLDKVSTDIVFNYAVNNREMKGLVIPVKTTTRERIVQPFAHQRILDSAAPGRYKSILVCVSETQGDQKKLAVNEICVPGTIKLFQKHLARLSGIYYLDPPARYMQLDKEGTIEVKSVGALLTGRLKSHLEL